MEIIKKIDKFKKAKQKKINKIINFSKVKEFNISNKNKINITYKNNVFKFKFKFYGILKNDIFMWANIIPGVSKEIIKNVKNIKSSARLFKEKNDDKSLFYYQLLSENMLYITDDNQKEWIVDLLLYLDNSMWSLTTLNLKGNLQFITLNDLVSFK